MENLAAIVTKGSSGNDDAVFFKLSDFLPPGAETMKTKNQMIEALEAVARMGRDMGCEEALFDATARAERVNGRQIMVVDARETGVSAESLKTEKSLVVINLPKEGSDRFKLTLQDIAPIISKWDAAKEEQKRLVSEKNARMESLREKIGSRVDKNKSPIGLLIGMTEYSMDGIMSIAPMFTSDCSLFRLPASLESRLRDMKALDQEKADVAMDTLTDLLKMKDLEKKMKGMSVTVWAGRPVLVFEMEMPWVGAKDRDDLDQRTSGNAESLLKSLRITKMATGCGEVSESWGEVDKKADAFMATIEEDKFRSKHKDGRSSLFQVTATSNEKASAFVQSLDLGMEARAGIKSERTKI